MSPLLLSIISTVIVLGVLIFVHELGHFLTAKAVDIEVPRFSIGFGPKIIGFRRGETEYVISALPLGGYVKMAGMEEMEAIEGGDSTISEMVEHRRPGEARAVRPRDFEAKPIWARALVIAAGVLMNLLFAFVVFTAIAMIWGVARDPGRALGGVNEELLPAGAAALTGVPRGALVSEVADREVSDWAGLQRAIMTARAGETEIRFENAQPVTIRLPAADSLRADLMNALEPDVPLDPVLGGVVADGPAHRAGLKAGDRVLEAGGEPIRSWQDFVAVIERNPGEPVPVVVQRGEVRVNLQVTPDARSAHGLRWGRIGVSAYYTADDVLPREAVGPIRGLTQGAVQTWGVVTLTVDFLAGIVTGRQSARNVGGPIMIGQMSGKFARAGLEAFLGFMALLSVNLAVLNLLPIPVLDGGHLVFLAVEAVRGRPLSVEQRMRLAQLGFIVLVAIMVWAFGNDLMRVFGL